jgi:hypothetical protein
VRYIALQCTLSMQLTPVRAVAVWLLQRCWCAAGPMGRHTFSSSSSSRGLTSLAQGPRTWASQTPVIGACRHQPSIWGVLHTRATLAAHPLPLHHDQQQQQRRGLFAARAKVKPNYQDHNQKKPPKIKLKTPR